MEPLKIFISDDHPVVRIGLRKTIEKTNGFTVVGEAGTGPDTLRGVKELQPDILLLDIEMPGLSGRDVARQLISEKDPVRILIISAYDDPRYIQGMLELGISGYLLKDEMVERIIEAIHCVATGEEIWISPELREKIARLEKRVHLTPRELEVIQGVAAGKTNIEIAHELSVSQKTVEKHLFNLFEKLGVYSRVEVALWAVREKVV